MHNEYHGHRYPVCDGDDYARCFFNPVTYVRCDDAGATFGHVTPAPDPLVAFIANKYAPDDGIFGAFDPSNMIERDGAHYVFFRVRVEIAAGA